MIAMTKELLAVDIQNALHENTLKIPKENDLRRWANTAYGNISDAPTEMTIRLVESAEMSELNLQYRGKTGTTNVLSFPFENDTNFELDFELHHSGSELQALPDLLGDVVICHDVIIQEALDQTKNINDHYAHMVTHGVLHLCGYDHIETADAEEMEALEVTILAQSQIQNPYT